MPKFNQIIILLLILSLLTLTIPRTQPTFAADCGVTAVGFTPLTDLGTGTYLGYQGGLPP